MADQQKGLRRREFLTSMLAAGVLPAPLLAAASPSFRVRTITAGVPMIVAQAESLLAAAAAFLDGARSRFADLGYEVQTLRVTTPPVAEYLPDWHSASGLRALERLDAICREHGLILSIGPVIQGGGLEEGLGDWAAELIGSTRAISFSVGLIGEGGEPDPGAVRSAADVIAALAKSTPGGEGNFNVAATAHCPPGTPFFPAGWHQGGPSFAIGLETPPLLLAAADSRPEGRSISAHFAAVMDRAFEPLEHLALEVAAATGRPYLGIDVSPAPGPDASIGEVIEAVSGGPFGSPSTLRACAGITDALKRLAVKTCGYSGLMLPVLEDRVLARRAAEGRYGIAELLLYSSVCGTGLDVVPVPGDSSPQALAAVIGDVAALSNKYRKPLSARLFPVPGKSAGDPVTFDNPFLTDSVVLALDRSA